VALWQNDTSLDKRLAEQLVEHRRLFFRLAYDVLRDRTAAQDVSNDAMLKGWEQRKKLRDPARLRNWVAEVVVNESLQYLRRAKTEQRILAVQNTVLSERADQTPGAQIGLREAVIAALEKLPETDRLIVVLTQMEDMTGKQVASLIDCSQGEVSKKLTHAMQRLRKLLKDWRFETHDHGRNSNVL
jgi:RNA polymerase sigma-70 factor (ECF subfamily)